MGVPVGLKDLVPGGRQPEQEPSKHPFLVAISTLSVVCSVTQRGLLCWCCQMRTLRLGSQEPGNGTPAQAHLAPVLATTLGGLPGQPLTSLGPGASPFVTGRDGLCAALRSFQGISKPGSGRTLFPEG